MRFPEEFGKVSVQTTRNVIHEHLTVTRVEFEFEGYQITALIFDGRRATRVMAVKDGRHLEWRTNPSILSSADPLRHVLGLMWKRVHG